MKSDRSAPRGKPHDAGIRARKRAPAGAALKPPYWDEAMVSLGRSDRVLRKLIRAYPDIHLKRRSDPFTTLARAIVDGLAE